jgi:DNA polymerase-3 subunit epsilon
VVDMNILDNVTIFDFETTGLDPKNDRVIELAAVKVKEGRIVGEFSTIIKQDIKLPEKITELTGITDKDLESGMDELISFKILNHMIGDSLLAAHNAAFDMAYLHHTLQRFGGKTFSNNFIDTMTISRERSPYPHKLEDMCRKYDIILEGAHRALNDVHGCWELLKKLHEEDPVESYINKLGYKKKYGSPEWVPAHAKLYGV